MNKEVTFDEIIPDKLPDPPLFPDGTYDFRNHQVPDRDLPTDKQIFFYRRIESVLNTGTQPSAYTKVAYSIWISNHIEKYNAARRPLRHYRNSRKQGGVGWQPDDPGNVWAAPCNVLDDMDCTDYGIFPWGDS